jgi:hypothetical protein
MFERFTDRGRRVVVLAQEEARLLNHNYIGTEHVLLGLLREGEGIAARVLTNLGIGLDEVRGEVERIIGRGSESPHGHVPFTPRAKKVLELSLREALQLGHNYIGTEHLLLGLVREGQGVAAQVLLKRGADLDRVRRQTIELLSTAGPAAAPPPQSEHRSTPAATRAEEEARRLAGERPVGTHHLLSAILRDEQSVAAKALAALGVTPSTVLAQLAALDPSGTTDELPEEAGARHTTIEILGDKIAVLFHDDELRERLTRSLPREGDALVLRSPDPAAESFPRLWRAFHHILTDVAWRLEKEAIDAWRPPQWAQGWEVAAYAVVSRPGGVESHLEVAPGVDRDEARAGLAAWLTSNQPLGRDSSTYLSILVDRGDDPESWGHVTEMATGVHGDWPRAQVQLLVAHAIVDLTSPSAA